MLRDDGTLTLLDPLSAEAPAAAPQTRQRKWHKANKAGKKLQREIDADNDAHSRKSKVSDEDKAAVEAALIGGMSVVACYEKFSHLGVSDAWFYLVRSRLRTEGKL